MDDLKTKSVLIYDYGTQIEVALKLAEKFGKVFYFANWADVSPTSEKALIGRGLEAFGVFKVEYFWDMVDKVDMICFFDTYNQDIVEYLRTKGYRVFGSGLAETLETDRKFGREVQQSAGLPVQDSKIVIGIKALGDAIRDEGDVFVKLNTFRGDIETFYAKDYDTSKIYLDKLAVLLGPRQDSVEFMLEKKIEGIEPGYDGFVVDGKYSNYCLWGYEKKESGYIGQVVKTADVPGPVKNVNDKLAAFFEVMKTRSFFSTEVMVDEKQQGFLIDPTLRCPMTVGTALHLEMWSNLAEFIWSAAGGELIDLIPAYKFGCGVSLLSDFAGENWLEIEIDPKVRRFIKFYRMMMASGKYYAVPGDVIGCTVIGLGDSVDEAVNNLKQNIKGVSGFQLESDCAGIDNVLNEIRDGSKFGLPDFTTEV